MTFFFLNKAEKELWLPQLFDLLYENMHTIAPSGQSYEEEKTQWLAAVSPALDKAPRQISLCFADGMLAGYMQYYIREQMLMVEELQLKKKYQQTTVFYLFCKHLLSALPQDLQTIEAYAHKPNHNSILLMKRLGMQICEEETGSPFVHLRGSAEPFYRLFRR